MPDVEVERKLLCRTCGHESEHHFGPQGDAPRSCALCEAEGSEDGPLFYDHPFDGVPYAPCPECFGIGTHDVLDERGLTVRGVRTCTECHGARWVQEEARA